MLSFFTENPIVIILAVIVTQDGYSRLTDFGFGNSDFVPLPFSPQHDSLVLPKYERQNGWWCVGAEKRRLHLKINIHEYTVFMGVTGLKTPFCKAYRPY